MSEQIARPFAWVALVVLMSGPNVAMPTNPARAADCRSAPDSPAPGGTHWYYRLDWETQRKCWYVRASGRRAHQTTTMATVVPATASHAAPASSDPTPVADVRPTSPSPGDTTRPSPQAETSALKAISAPVSGETIDKTPRQSALEESSTPSEEASTRQAGTSPEAGAQTAVSPMVWAPDRPTSVTSTKPQESGALTGTDADVMSDEAENNPRSSGPINNAATPMIVFPVLALGLALLGIGSRFLIKHDAARRAQVNDRGRHEGRDGLHRQESVIQGQEFHSFVSVVSDQGTLRGDGETVKITREISKRRHKLAQLRQHIESMLRSATGPYAQPLQEQTHA
jgi:hypothetical protein